MHTLNVSLMLDNLELFRTTSIDDEQSALGHLTTVLSQLEQSNLNVGLDKHDWISEFLDYKS